MVKKGARGKGGAHGEGGAHGQGAGTDRGARGREGARTCVPLMVAAAPRHVGGVGAYARAHHWGANGGRAWLQGGAYICFVLLI
jgi:hypothetical protein